MSDLLELAERLEYARNILDAMRMQNAPTNAKDRLKADARHRIAHDQFLTRQREYQDALAAASEDELNAAINDNDGG